MESAIPLMTAAAATITALRRAIGLLAELDDPAATRTAEVLTRLLDCETFESAAGLASGWHHHVEQKEREAALDALVALFPDMDDTALARRIAAGVKRAERPKTASSRSVLGGSRCPRPDGEAGHYRDLARAGFDLAERSCRRLVADIRGQRNTVIGHADESPSTQKLENKAWHHVNQR